MSVSGSIPGGAFGRSGGRSGNRAGRTWLRVLVPLVALVVLVEVVAYAVTEYQWFASVGFQSVFSTVWATRVVLFLAFTLVDLAWLGGNTLLAFQLRPGLRPANTSNVLMRYRSLMDSRRTVVLLLPALFLAVWGGISAAAQAETVLAWRHATAFGVRDPYFGLDVSFFVFTYPWLRYLLGHAMAMAIVGAIGAGVMHLAVGGLQNLRPGRRHGSGRAGAHLGVLMSVVLLLLGLSALLDRLGYEITPNSLFTGVGYTDAHVRFGAKLVVAIICFLCAAMFALNAWLRRWAVAWVASVLLLVSSIILLGIYPAVVQRIHVKPNVPVAEGPYVSANITATRDAYKIAQARTTDNYAASTTADATQLKADAEALPAIRLIDPSLVAPAFDALQQAQRYYTFPGELDVDHYTIGGKSTDVVVAAREIDPGAIPDKSWSNVHTVYTHGYGVVAAYGNQADNAGEPVWLDRGTTPTGALKQTQPRIYFGEGSSDYVVVGATNGTAPVELDTPSIEASGAQELYSYTGSGGVAIGGLVNRLLYSLRLNDLNLAISSRVNSASRILTDREPVQRVQKVAPWLTPDSDPYPTVVNGRIVWVVDCYTMTANYPNSQQVGWQSAITDSASAQRSLVADRQVNYVRNSVKATVDAYDGTVQLYGWDESDPILQTWQKVYPGLVKPKAEIPAALLPHLRYPQDLYTVQRGILARYHTTDPNDFIQKSDLWQVPDDPTRNGADVQPPYYLTVRWPSEKSAVFSLTSVYTPNARPNMIAYMAVDADASSPTYGTMRVLRMSDSVNVAGPGQTFSVINGNGDVAAKLRPYTGQGSSSAIYANLMTLPVGGGLLYVEPVYTQVTGSTGSYPVMRFVVVRFGSKVGIGDTLQQALNSVFGAGTPSTNEPPKTPTATKGVAAAQQYLAQATAAFQAADEALKKGDLAGYQAQLKIAQARTASAIAALK